MMTVVRGCVRIRTMRADGKEVVLATLGPGPLAPPVRIHVEFKLPLFLPSGLTIDKLLLEEEDSDTYALNHTLSVEGF